MVAGEFILGARELTRYLPHRFPFLLVDGIVEFQAGERIVGIKNVTVNEWFFQGHFPGQPILPGVLILEAMAQVGIVFAKLTDPALEERLIVFAGIDSVRFRRQVEPGHRMVLHLEHQRRKGPIWKMAGRAEVEGEVACEALLTAALAQDQAGRGGR